MVDRRIIAPNPPPGASKCSALFAKCEFEDASSILIKAGLICGAVKCSVHLVSQSHARFEWSDVCYVRQRFGCNALVPSQMGYYTVNGGKYDRPLDGGQDQAGPNAIQEWMS